MFRLIDHAKYKLSGCFSLKIERATSFEAFVARYVTKGTPLQGLGELEDLICENMAWSG